ncbi:MAG: sigma-70 family RNA polymerase sigma factor [Planctomycetes bacterium]|nr:sigma-70 family RNA polymerase sigma factor [Planctomycetota bacterium]
MSLATDALYDGGSDGDAELVRRIRRGDEVAFCGLVDRHGRRLYTLAYALLGNSADAEDVVQETFIGALAGLGGFRGQASLKTWLTRILVNRVSKLRRYRKVRRAMAIEDMDDMPGGGGSAGAAQADRADIRMDVAAVLRRLPAHQRTVIILREMQQMSYEEISTVLGVPRGTVESRLFRARRRLKSLLKDYLP